MNCAIQSPTHTSYGRRKFPATVSDNFYHVELQRFAWKQQFLAAHNCRDIPYHTTMLRCVVFIVLQSILPGQYKDNDNMETWQWMAFIWAKHTTTIITKESIQMCMCMCIQCFAADAEWQKFNQNSQIEI